VGLLEGLRTLWGRLAINATRPEIRGHLGQSPTEDIIGPITHDGDPPIGAGVEDERREPADVLVTDLPEILLEGLPNHRRDGDRL
jgi:hypothetical protein